MSVHGTPSDPDPRVHAVTEQDQGANAGSRSAAPDAPAKRPWGWIAVAGLLAAGLIGVAIYAMNLNSDLDDANAKVASQQKQIASQQKELEEAQSPGANVVAAAKRAYDTVRSQLGAAQQGAGQASAQASQKLTQAEQAAADAKGTAAELKTKAAAAQAKAEAAGTCAQSFLSAFSGVFSGSTLKAGVEAAVKELKTLQPLCAAALRQGGSAP